MEAFGNDPVALGRNVLGDDLGERREGTIGGTACREVIGLGDVQGGHLLRFGIEAGKGLQSGAPIGRGLGIGEGDAFVGGKPSLPRCSLVDEQHEPTGRVGDRCLGALGFDERLGPCGVGGKEEVEGTSLDDLGVQQPRGSVACLHVSGKSFLHGGKGTLEVRRHGDSQRFRSTERCGGDGDPGECPGVAATHPATVPAMFVERKKHSGSGATIAAWWSEPDERFVRSR